MNDDRDFVLVTGSSGLLGRRACLALVRHGFDVFGIDQAEPSEASKHDDRVFGVECDLTSDVDVRAAVNRVRQSTGGRLASVLHMAAYYDFSGEDSPLYDEVTVKGTDRLLDALSEFELGQFLFTSTMLVHQPCKLGERIREDTPLQAKWPYPQSKIDTEQLIRNGYPDIRSVFLRLAGVYTDWGQQPTLVQQIKRIYERDFQGLFFPGNPKSGQSSVYLDDAVDAIVRCVQRRDSIDPTSAILVGEEDPPSYERLQDEIGKLIHGKEWPALCVPESIARAGAAVSDVLSGGDAFIKPFMVNMADDHYALDTSRAKKILGWSAQHTILHELPGIIERLKRDPDRWYRENGLKE